MMKTILIDHDKDVVKPRGRVRWRKRLCIVLGPNSLGDCFDVVEWGEEGARARARLKVSLSGDLCIPFSFHLFSFFLFPIV